MIYTFTYTFLVKLTTFPQSHWNNLFFWFKSYFNMVVMLYFFIKILSIFSLLKRKSSIYIYFYKKWWGIINFIFMSNLFILNEIYTNGYRVEVLDIISLVAILCSILVIISKNPIVSVLFLIGLFLSIASYLMILGLNFIGLAYLLVYVGAVSILFLFILMLINVRISELLSNTSNSIPLAIFITISFNYPVYQILPYSIASFNNYTVNLNNTLNDIWYNNYTDFFNKLFNLSGVELDNGEISFVTSKIWDGNLAENSHITSLGNIMYTSYSIWLILTSIILLLAMVGAIVITIKQKN